MLVGTGVALVVAGLVVAGCASHTRPKPPVQHEIMSAAAGGSIDVESIPGQRIDLPVEGARLVFPVKFMCGEAGPSDRLTAGHYRTVINVLNVGRPDSFSAEIKWWFVTVPATIQGAQAVVKGTSSLVMDCDFILQNLAAAGVDVAGLVEGFVQLEETTTRGFFRVTAVYSMLHKQRHSTPDLIPVKKAPGFCRLDDQGRLLVTIGNIGEIQAQASAARITFADGSAVNRATPPLAPGAETTLEAIPLPGGEGTITFRIEADQLAQIVESDEMNNRVQGFCTIIK